MSARAKVPNPMNPVSVSSINRFLIVIIIALG